MATNATTDVNKMAAFVFGAVFVLVGILGFVDNPVLGLFEVSLVHNLVHLLSGAALLAAGFVDNGRHARIALLTLGIVYALVTVLGFLAGNVLESLGIAINDADNFLHLLLAGALIAVPLIFKGDTLAPQTTARV